MWLRSVLQSYQSIRQQVIALILATDMQEHVDLVSRCRVSAGVHRGQLHFRLFQTLLETGAVGDIHTRSLELFVRSQIKRNSTDFNFMYREEDAVLVRKMLLKMADLSHALLCWRDHFVWTCKISEEFYRQVSRRGKTVCLAEHACMLVELSTGCLEKDNFVCCLLSRLREMQRVDSSSPFLPSAIGSVIST